MTELYHVHGFWLRIILPSSQLKPLHNLYAHSYYQESMSRRGIISISVSSMQEKDVSQEQGLYFSCKIILSHLEYLTCTSIKTQWTLLKFGKLKSRDNKYHNLIVWFKVIIDQRREGIIMAYQIKEDSSIHQGCLFDRMVLDLTQSDLLYLHWGQNKRVVDGS